MRIPFAQIDAFSTEPFAGNPAAVMVLPRWPGKELLQRIAAENNLPATAFLVARDGDFELRWFGPHAELGLCGHGTLAAGHFVLSSDNARDRVAFRALKSGATLEVARAGTAYSLQFPAIVPTPKPLPAIVAALGIECAADSLWHDGGYVLIVLEDEAAVRGLAPDHAALAAVGSQQVTATAPGDRADIVSRVFVRGGHGEDQVTGSSHAASATYWARRLGRDTFTAHQASARGGDLSVRLDGDRVVLGGRCATVIEGTFLLP